VVAAVSLLSGCGTPFLPSDLTEKGNGGVLVRAFILSAKNEGVHHHEGSVETVREDKRAGGKSMSWYHSPYEPHVFKIFHDDRRYATIDVGFGNGYVGLGESASALGVQTGDLVEYLSYEWDPFLPGGRLVDRLNAVRIVCKFYDEECITANRRDYWCEDGAMIVDGERREDKPCGGFGEQSEEYASVVGPIDQLYGDLENYLRTYDAPWGRCLITDMSCGKEQGLAIPKGEFSEWVKQYPNYLAANQAARSFVAARLFRKPGTLEWRWAVYLSENLFSKTPVMSKREFAATLGHEGFKAERPTSAATRR
jgi:hypothetical protein